MALVDMLHQAEARSSKAVLSTYPAAYQVRCLTRSQRWCYTPSKHSHNSHVITSGQRCQCGV